MQSERPVSRPDAVSSDFEIEEAPPEQLEYGWSLLLDLEGSFRGSMIGFTISVGEECEIPIEA